MLEHVKIEDILFLDIETVPQHGSFNELSPELQHLWDKKSAFFRTEDQTPEEVYQRAGIYAEFGKIVCISVGVVVHREGKQLFRLKSFAGEDEFVLLTSFANMLVGFSRDVHKTICGHNVKEFDIPFIARRLLINGIKLPLLLDIAGKKPWEVKFVDTLELWKFGDYKHYTSLNLLTTIFNIPSPKDDIDGSQVASVFYNDKDVQRIARYCEKDVFATAQLLLRFMGEPLMDESALVLVD